MGPLIGRLRIGYRGSILLSFTAVSLLYGLSLTDVGPGSALSAARAGFLPLWFLAAWWATVGVAAGVFAFVRRDGIGYLIACGQLTLWTMLHLAFWLVGHVDRAWVTAVLFAGYGVGMLIDSARGEPAPRREEP